MQSNVYNRLPKHVAIIMDGNGRWAQRRGLPRPVGHRRGAGAVRRIVEHAAECGIENLTLFAFSADNWRRPGEEVATLMSLFERYLCSELPRCRRNGVALHVIGRRDRLSANLNAAIARAERVTRKGTVMTLRLAVDYSSRWALREAACLARGVALRDAMAGLLHAAAAVPDVDLLIRSGGEQRLSDFLLLECAYAELCFTAVLWPDFKPAHLDRALADFQRRWRRYGSYPEEQTDHKEVPHGPPATWA